jgi:hypothetical protein
MITSVWKESSRLSWGFQVLIEFERLERPTRCNNSTEGKRPSP